MFKSIYQTPPVFIAWNRLLCLLALAAAPLSILAFSGTPPVGYTGAPPQNLTCAECHFGIGSGTLELVIGNGDGLYIPGETYPVQVKITDPGQERFGFSMVSRIGSSLTQPTGTWTSGVESQVYDGGNHIGHQTAPFASGSFIFNMMWTAPAQDIGPVHFYLAANAANGNFGNGPGDNIYTTEMVLEPGMLFETFWSQSPLVNGWRDTGAGYPDIAGIGFLYDAEWPWCYSYAFGADSGWLYIYPDDGDESAFWAYNLNGGYFMRVFASVGWYYSLESGAEGWHRISF